MVALSLLAALASTVSLAVAAPAPAQLAERADFSACTTGDAVHMIIARASTELPGEGIIGQVATMVKAQLPGSTSEAISYPATLYPYLSSEAAGVSAMTSAGAHVVGDALCGSSGLFGGFSLPSTIGGSTSSPWSFSGLSKRDLESFSPSSSEARAESPSSSGKAVVERAISSSATDNIVAVVQMGDPSFTPGQSYDAGTSFTRGLFPRSSSGVQCLQGFADRIKSYCDIGDEFCASGYSLSVHLSYVLKYGSQAASFIVSKARA